MRCAAPHASLTAHDLVEDLRVAAREERAAVDHHVDLVGAERDGLADVLELDRRAATGPDGNAVATRGDLHARAGEPLLRDGDEVRVDADRGDRRDRRVGRIRVHRLARTAPRPCPACRRPRASSGPSSGSRGRARRASTPFLIERFASSPARASSATASTEPIRGSRRSSGSSTSSGRSCACAIAIKSSPARIGPRLRAPGPARYRVPPWLSGRTRRST